MGALLAASLALILAAPGPAGATPAGPAAATAETAAAPDVVAPQASPLSSGTFGTLSLPALALPEPGHLSFALSGAGYSGKDFLLPDTTTSFTTEALAFSVGVLSWLEVYGAVAMRQASASSASSKKSLSSVGDFDLGAKAVFSAAGPLSAGALVQLDLPSGVDQVSVSGVGLRTQVLAGLALPIGPVPFVTALALGYHFDDTGRLVTGSVSTLSAFGLSISRYDTVSAGLSIQSPLRYASPVVELITEAPVARDEPLPAGGHPIRARVLFGANAIGLGVRGLQASAGVMFSLVKTGQLQPDTLPMSGWPPDPPWAAHISISWTFQPKLPERAKEMRWKTEPQELAPPAEAKARPVAGVTTVAAAGAAKPNEPAQGTAGVKANADSAEHELEEMSLVTLAAPPIPADHGRLSLFLVDARTQHPVPGAWVSLIESPDLEATSGADGRVRLDPLPGPLTLAVASDGFEPTTQPVTAVAGQERHITVQLQPVHADCTLKGRIASEDGELLRASLQLVLAGSSGAPPEARTYEGTYAISVTHGQWSVTATAPGFTSEAAKVELLPGETRLKDLVLKRVAGDPVARLTPQGAEFSRRVAFLPFRSQLMPQASGPLGELATALAGLSMPLVVGVRVEAIDLGASADDAVAALKLGEERARALVEFLVGKGVPKQWLTPRGLGLAAPGQPTLELKRATGGSDRPKSVVSE